MRTKHRFLSQQSRYGVMAGALSAMSLLAAVGCGSSDEDDNPSSGRAYTVSTLLDAAPIPGANGIAAGADGALRVASVAGRRVVTLDPDSGEILDVHGLAEGVEAPDDVAVGPDGTTYYTAFLTGQVGRISPDGERSTVADLAVGVNPIAISPDGRIFVGLCFFGDALYELDPEGKTAPRTVAENIGNGCAINGMAFGPDGLLYGPQPLRQRIVRVDVASGAVEEVVGGLSATAYGAKFNSRGELFAVDGGRVLHIDIASKTAETFAELPFVADNLTFDAADRLFVTSGDTGEVLEVKRDGSLRSVIRGGLISPEGLVVTSQGGDDRLTIATGATLAEVDGATGEIAGSHLSTVRMSTIAPYGDGFLATSSFGSGVWAVSASGEVEQQLAGFQQPTDALALDGTVLVADIGAKAIVRADPSDMGAQLPVFGDVAPSALASRGGDVWMSDWEAGTVVQLAAGGELLPEPSTVATGLSGPQGLAVSGDGELLVVEATGGRLSAIDLATGSVRILYSELPKAPPPIPGFSPTGPRHGVAVGASGVIYVTGGPGAPIVRLSPST